MKPFQTKVKLKYGEKDFSGEIENFSYIDEANGASDSITVVLNDIDGEWHGSRMPKKSTKITASIVISGNNMKRDKSYNCGSFYLDDVEIQGYPSSCTLGAVSDPVSYAFKTRKRNKTWKNTNLEQVTKDIAKNYLKGKMKVVYDAPLIKISALDQDGQTDSSFLNQITEKYGCGLKVYADKLVVYSIEEYEKKHSVKTLTEKDIEPGWIYRTTINENYTGVKLSYKKTGGKKIEVQAGTTKRMLNLSEKVDSMADAMKVALARVNKENANTTTLSFTLRTPAFLSATSCITMQGMGALSGKYFVTRVRHVISNGYKVQVECRKIMKRIMDPNKAT